jgi:hypothetical protein
MHAVYGVRVASELALPAPLASASDAPDVVIELGAPGAGASEVRWFSDRLMPDGEPWLRIGEADDGRYLLRVLADADFWVDRNGGRIACHPVAEPLSELEQLVLDQIMPLALHAAGRFVLHAAAVKLERGAVALVAQSGAGKSTLAAFLSRRGAHLSDDCLRVAVGDAGIEVFPGPACARLRPDSARAVTGQERPPEEDDGSKLRVTLAGWPERVPLRRIYLLGPASNEPQLLALSPRDAAAALARHLFRLDTRDRARLAAELDLLATLAAAVPVRELRYARSYAELERVADLVQADLERDAASPATEIRCSR